METITLIKRGLIFKVLVIVYKEYPRFPATYMNITAQFQVKSISIHMSYLILILKYLSTCVSLCMCVCILMFLVENVCKYEKKPKALSVFYFSEGITKDNFPLLLLLYYLNALPVHIAFQIEKGQYFS